VEIFEYSFLFVFLFLGAFIAASAIIVGKLLGFNTKSSKNKMAPYECGIETIGSARIQFKVAYYLFALLFLVFDIEVLFLFPILSQFRSIAGGETSLVPYIVLIELSFFIFLIGFILAYAWKKGVLKWE